MSSSSGDVNLSDGLHDALATTQHEGAAAATPSLNVNAPRSTIQDDDSVVNSDARPQRTLGSTRSPRPASERTLLQTATIMVSLCACVFVAALEVTIVSTALPTISAYFAAPSGYTWIGTSVSVYDYSRASYHQANSD